MAGGANGPPVLNGPQVEYPTKTFAQVRAIVYARLGFIDPFSNAPTRTIEQIRDSIIQSLGFPDALPYIAQRTLAQLTVQVVARCGFGVQAEGSLPPGMQTTVWGIINEAQQTVFRRIELDRGGLVSFPAFMTAGSDQTDAGMDYVPTLALAIGMAKAHYGQEDAKAYFDQYEKFMKDHANTRPPNLEQTLVDLIKEAQQDAYRRYELGTDVYALSPFSVISVDRTTIDYRPVQLLATARAKALYGQKDAQVYFDQYEKYWADVMLRFPPNAKSIVSEALTSAQAQLYHRYPMLRTEKWFSWATVAGERFYDVPKIGADTLDFRRVTEAWYQDSETWRPLNAGIPPWRFSETSDGHPDSFELREFLEIWPAPDASGYTLWLKGHLGLRPFEADADETTIDHELIVLMTLATVKPMFRQPDADAMYRQLQVHLGRLNAGTFSLKRFIPGSPSDAACAALPMPKATFRP